MNISRALLILALLLGFPLDGHGENRRVRVGVTLPLSGEFAPWAEAVRRTLELASERENFPFSFDYQDEGNCEPQKALSAYRLYQSAGIHYAILGCLTGTKAVLPIAKSDNILLFSIGLLDESAFTQSGRIINLATQLSTESAFLAKRVAQRGFHRIAIVHWNDAFSDEFARTLVQSLEGLGVKIVSNQGVDPKETDYRPVLLKAKMSAADALCFNLGQDQQGIMVKQVHQLGLPLTIFSNYPFETPAALALGVLAEKVEYTFPLNAAEAAPEKLEFDSAFKRRFGASAIPNANSYFMWDGLTLLEKALAQCPADDVACVARYFKSTKSFSGLSGQISFQEDGSNSRPYGIKSVKAGKFVWVEKNL